MKKHKLLTNKTQSKRRSKEEWFDHIEAWKTSGLTQKVYCQQQSLCLRQFVQWRCRFKKDRGVTDSSTQVNDFIPVQVIKGNDSGITHSHPITVTLPNQIRLSFTQSSDVSLAVAMVRQLMGLSC